MGKLDDILLLLLPGDVNALEARNRENQAAQTRNASRWVAYVRDFISIPFSRPAYQSLEGGIRYLALIRRTRKNIGLGPHSSKRRTQDLTPLMLRSFNWLKSGCSDP